MKGTYDAFDLGDARVDVPLDPFPVFMTMRLDRALLRAVTGDERRQGRGAIPARAGHLGVHRPAGPMWITWCCRRARSTGPHLHREVAEFYYVMNGDGVVTVAAESAPIHSGRRDSDSTGGCALVREHVGPASGDS